MPPSSGAPIPAELAERPPGPGNTNIVTETDPGGGGGGG
jgi:hypothetical protein